MARGENHVRDRLRNVEAELASLRSVASEIQRLRAIADNLKWLLKALAWAACTVGAEMLSGGLGRVFAGLAKLFG